MKEFIMKIFHGKNFVLKNLLLFIVMINSQELSDPVIFSQNTLEDKGLF